MRLCEHQEHPIEIGVLENELQPQLKLARIKCRLRLRGIQAPDAAEIIWSIQEVYRFSTNLECIRVVGKESFTALKLV